MGKNFKPNVEWMAEKYDEMNSQLFRGELGPCNFKVFTTGRGSEGGTLGWFKITGYSIRVDRYSRRIFRDNWGDRTYVNKGNFYDLCQPTIELNGNYSGTEHGFLATLVHEMCHYYTYMYGYAPKQGHGPEFRQIGTIVSSRSNGMFTIQRLASAEDMSELELSDEMKAKRAKRMENRKASVTAVVAFTKNGQAKLTISSNQNLINMISTSEEERGSTVYTSNDAEVIDFLFEKGFRKNMRTWRYWSIENKPWINELKSMLSAGAQNKQEELVAASKPKSQEPEVKKEPKRIFTINTSAGKFESEATSFTQLFNVLKEKFPKMSDETIKKIMNNPANYRIVENKQTAKDPINEVIDEFINKMFSSGDDTIEITPDMDLGKYSPLEIR